MRVEVLMMQVAIDLPDHIAQRLQQTWGDIPCRVIESIALEGYRSGALNESEVRQLLGFATRYEVHGFLKAHGVSFYTSEDLENDLSTLDELNR
ncbi:MAG: hypothetical protein ETSY1_41685 [Candidatus Entotheonella factor]|uniref:Uncharacterized protein n=2 Tax=Candidatus Entotheonella TaxID=93171 RepID=W4L6E0_ENTF1|nr:MAG: hypothetical protein ETSY1_41685 [Candidatus Entotheonella factor]